MTRAHRADDRVEIHLAGRVETVCTGDGEEHLVVLIDDLDQRIMIPADRVVRHYPHGPPS